MEKKEYQLSLEDVKKEVRSQSSGLSQKEAQKRLKENGPNQLKEAPKKSVVALFLETFKDAMVVILLIVAVIQMVMGEFFESFVILIVLLMNAVVSVIQAKKAEGSLEALKSLAAPDANVIRDGKETVVLAKDLVVGDVVILEAGDYVPADGRLLEEGALKIDEGMLTGESVPVEKDLASIDADVPLGDRSNMVFSGTIVTYGRGVFLVTATANETEIGKVAGLLENTTEQKTPLQRSLDRFSKKLSVGILGLSVLIFVVQIARIFMNGGSANMTTDILNAFMFAIAVAVAGIPEALQSIVTIVLSLGTKQMAHQHAIIRKLPAVETLGSASVVCTDKTGTLTQNKMTVVDYYLPGEKNCTIPSGSENWSKAQNRLIAISVLVNDAAITEEEEKIGDPTEIAFLDYTEALKEPYRKVRETHPRLQELPFDSDRKLMSTLHLVDGEHLLLTKGGPDVVLERSTHVLMNDEVIPLTKDILKKIQTENEAYSNRALRVLAFAYKPIEDKELSLDDENGLIFVGLMAMIDPPRESVTEAVADAKSAGIKTVMITGDHKTTAVAIAREIGIFEEGDLALTGAELDALSEDELKQKLEHISVYARVSPENKIRIVNAWQEKGNISAMTGDGVNDAPALKQADIGIAMGTGTDVAKDASAMILTDDNFASIISAVKVGRNVFDNIQKAVAYLFAGNLGAIIAIIFALLVGWNNPFTALQLLFINLVNDSLPAIALGTEKAEPTIMKRNPRNPNEDMFSGNTVISVVYRGTIIGIVVILAQWIGLQHSPQLGVAMAFSTLIWSRTLQTLPARSNSQTAIKAGLFSNKAVILAVGVCSALYFMTLIPGLRSVFSLPATFNLRYLLISFGLAVLATILMEVVKIIREKFSQTNKEEKTITANKMN